MLRISEYISFLLEKFQNYIFNDIIKYELHNISL